MKNRIPTELAANGALRYGVYDKDGNLLRYEYLKLEDNPTDPGTILAKETLLKDVTASLFGLGADAVPDDVLAFLGKYNQHWWERTVAGEREFVRSSDRNAYPDSGESDGYEWKYLGVPFDNAVTAPKVASGSYVGTGGAGPANANSFTFETPPILMAFVDKKGALLNLSPSGSVIVGICFPYLLTTEYQQYGLFQYSVWEENYGGSKSFYAKKSADGKTISWYSTSYYPTNQFNVAGITYNLVAICMGG